MEKTATMPKVSSLIVCYNQRNFIDEAIAGAVDQDYENHEIVVSDDGSTDDTPELVARWARRRPDKVRALLHDTNGGVTVNCNRGLRACSGELITLLGGDDAMLPGKISRQVEWMQGGPDRVLCGHELKHVNEDGSPRPAGRSRKRAGGAGPLAFIRGGTVIPTPGIMVRASAIPPHGFDESIRIASDLLFMIEVLAQGGTFGYLPEESVMYRHRSDSISMRFFEMLEDIGHTYEIVGRRYPQYRADADEAMLRNYWYFGGIRYLDAGDKGAARARFLHVVRSKPTYLKAWIRLLQTL